ncbi:MAG TPA: class I SAM-dependent methyltransferase [Acetobacteraceae bacterium]|nr:class I SAM-dependent methyltransferase [Acetobacteraceae bacterium]
MSSHGGSAQDLHIPPVFWGLQHNPDAAAALRALVATAGPGHPRNPWFIADNLITFGHTRGFLTDPRFVAAVAAEKPASHELAFIWRTHTLCWAAESALAVPGDYVECGTYQGYSMSVVLRYLDGLPGRRCYLYDLFDPVGGEGEGHRLPAHAPELFEQVRARFDCWDNALVTRGKVPEVLAQVAPARIAFLHLDMNNAQAEAGALEVLFDRVCAGGIVVFDDYGWTGYRAQKSTADAFMRARGLAVLELPTGQGLVIKR